MIRCNLWRILDDKGMKLRELERLIGCRFESLRNLANDETKRFPNELLYDVCRALNVTIGELLYLDHQPFIDKKKAAKND